MAVGDRNVEVTGAEEQVQEATNELEAAVPAQPQVAPVPVDATGLPQGVEWQEDDEPDYIPEDEDEEILFGDPTGATAGAGIRQTMEGPLPASLVRRLPALARAAQDPSAPPSLIALYRLTIQRLENELKRG